MTTLRIALHPDDCPPVLNRRVELAIERGDLARARFYADEAWKRMARYCNWCDYCGEEGTEANPVTEHLVSPPVSGHPVEMMQAHAACAARAAREAVR